MKLTKEYLLLLKFLEEWLGETTYINRIDNDLTTVPMLNPELSAFSRFFEIQASIKKKRRQRSLIQNILPISEMRKISTKLDQNKEEIGKVKTELMESSEIEGIKSVGKTYANEQSISSIDKRIETIKIESNSERFLKKLQKYSRVSAVRVPTA